MFYKNKVNGISSVETLIILSIVSIFLTLLFPILKVNNRINNMLYFQSFIDKNKGDIVKIIENSIENSQNYWNITNFNNSVVVLYYSRRLPYDIDEKFFNNKRNKGNLLFIKIPILKEGRILRKFLVFYLYRKYLCIYQGEYNGRLWCIENENIFVKNISGYFEKTERGVFINLRLKAGDMFEEIKGYENFKK